MRNGSKSPPTILRHWLTTIILVTASLLLLDPGTHPIMKGETTALASPGIGILGDSNSDEYRADDNRGGSYAATTLNWMELLVRRRGLNFGPWGSRGEPRRSGYEYNWARSGATTADMISSGQHTGLAKQVANGKVTRALIYIGTNDFHIWNHTYDEIYFGTLTGAALQKKIDGIVANIALAVDTLQKAGDVQIAIMNFLDPAISPDIVALFPIPQQRQRVSDAIIKVNAGLQSLGASRRVTIISSQGVVQAMLGRIDANGFLNVGGELINTFAKGNEPHNGRLDDALGHPGTVSSGFLANLFIDALNKNLGMAIASFTDQEILNNAGIIRVNPGGANAVSTSGSGSTVQAGYATITMNSGDTPYSTAVFSITQNDVIVSEVGVPASPPTLAARIFIDYRFPSPGKTARRDALLNPVNTGFAIVNRGEGTAHITYLLRDSSGASMGPMGHGELPVNQHRAKFISELQQIAPDFELAPDFPSVVQFGSLEVRSDQPISILALRLTTNSRGESLFTSTPVADLTEPVPTATLFFPQLVDGGGYRTMVMLLNTSGIAETGRLLMFGDEGSPLAVHPLNGAAATSFTYTIAPGGLFLFQTDGSAPSVNVGSLQVIPDAGSPAPVGAGVFSYGPLGMLVTESGIPAAVMTTHARVYIDQSNGHQTGLAIAAPSNNGMHVEVTAFQEDGVTGMGSGGIDLNVNGHIARFADEIINTLPSGFTGVLDITATAPFAALTLRSLTNTRGDFLLTTFPVADFERPAPSPILFPQIADGGGYQTQLIFLSTGGAASSMANFFGDDGLSLTVQKNVSGHR
jgi:hypothetical protein